MRRAGFSALQRAENSSISFTPTRRKSQRRVSVLFSEPKIPQLHLGQRRGALLQLFQCSSASRKFLNFSGGSGSPVVRVGFSALQRAENSSIPYINPDRYWHYMFQCSSASRKFLNCRLRRDRAAQRRCFSALQRAENSSIRRIL